MQIDSNGTQNERAHGRLECRIYWIFYTNRVFGLYRNSMKTLCLQFVRDHKSPGILTYPSRLETFCLDLSQVTVTTTTSTM